MTDRALFKHFNLTGKERGNRQVNCPFHEDYNASASINVKKRVLNCFACHKGWTFEQVAERLSSAGEKSTLPPPAPHGESLTAPPPALSDTDALALAHIEQRGYTLEELAQFVDVAVGIEGQAKYDGYLVLSRDGMAVARNLMDDGRPRYLNPPGNKRVFWVTDPPAEGAPAWITEGVWDALALASLGLGTVGATLGSSVSEAQAFELRGRTVFVAYDADAPGFVGAKESAETLRKFEARPVVVDFPRRLGNDPAEAFANDREALSSWLDETRAEYGHTDEGFVHALFRGGGALRSVPTGLRRLDELLGGGYKPGVHVIGAEPGVGKTSLAIDYTANACERGERALYITYEIPKRQCWARVASRIDALKWEALEADPTRAEPATQAAIRRLAERMRVVAGWSIEKIEHVIDHYDVVVVDYLQRMPGPFGENESRHNVAHNISRLSNLARDKGKVILVVSSMPRAEYGRATLRGLKDAGEIEYVAQSVTLLLSEQAGALLVGQVVKNTRGQRGTFWLAPDYEHQRFKEARPPGRGA